jgi:hypothetical protein
MTCIKPAPITWRMYCVKYFRINLLYISSVGSSHMKLSFDIKVVLGEYEFSMVWDNIIVKNYEVVYKKKGVLYRCLMGLQNRCLYKFLVGGGWY